MANKNISSTSFTLSDEFNLSGKRIAIKGKTGVALGQLSNQTANMPLPVEAFISGLLGALPVMANPGLNSFLPIERAVLGAVAVAGRIMVCRTEDGFNLDYMPSLLRVTDGAYEKNSVLNNQELLEFILLNIEKISATVGPARTFYHQLLKQVMEEAVLFSSLKGYQANCITGGDPVNLNTGNFLYEKKDIKIAGKVPISFRRFYNRIDLREGCLGHGWRHNFEIELIEDIYSYTVIWQDGREEVYRKGKNNMPEPLYGNQCYLVCQETGFQYTSSGGYNYFFDKKGRMVNQGDLNGAGVNFSYNKQGKLECASSCSGKLFYHYEDNGKRLVSVTDHTGRKVRFIYELGRLKQVINAMGESYRYFYDGEGAVQTIKNSRNINVLHNKYESQGRISCQSFADGGLITYDYQDKDCRTLMTNQNGQRIAYLHDERFRNTKNLYIDGEESFSYNDRNQLIKKIDKNGNKIKFSYDDKGNTIQIIYPDGSKHNMAYDANNRLITLSVNGKEKIKNTYDAKGNLIKTADALHRHRQIFYDEKGNAVKVKQPDGSELSLKYDDRGNMIHIIDAAGGCAIYEYDDCNRVIRTVDGNGNSTNFAYNDCDQIICVTNAAGACRTYEYTKDGKVTKVKDFNGAVTTQEYNNMNQVKSITLPDGGMICMEYDLMQNISRKIMPNGAEIRYAYNSFNHLEKVTLPTGGQICYEYDPNGNRTAIIDPNGNRTIMEYDELNRLIKTIDSAGASTEYEYDMEGRLISVTNAVGKFHTYVYDEAGQVISETDILGNTTHYAYNELGKIACVTDPKKRKIVYEYAPGGSLSRVRYPDDTYELFFYDKNRNLIRRQNQKGDFLEFNYDCLDRMTAIKSSFGQEKSYTYDAAGNITSEVDALGHKTYYTYSLGGKMISVVDAAGNRTEYAYDAMGDLITICQHQGFNTLLKENGHISTSSILDEKMVHIIQYKRNLLRKIETITDPLGLQEHYSYDLAGQMVSKKDKEGYITQYAYNPVGDIESITYTDGRSVTYTYNPLRQLIEIQDWLGTIRIEPDDMGRAKKIIDHRGREIFYQWGRMGEREAIIYPDGRNVFYEYDELSRLSRLVDGGREIRYCYNEDGRLSEKVISGGILSCYKYNAMGLLSSLTHCKDGKIFEQYGYEYDLMGNRTGVSKTRSTTSLLRELKKKVQDESGFYQYRYDNLNRLIEVRKDHKSLRYYEYDAFGNRIKKRTGQENISYHYNAANQLIRSERIFPGECYQYDFRGNLTAILKGGKIVNQYVYDETNRLVAASNDKGQTTSYQYNGFGNRVGMCEYVSGKADFGSNCNSIVQSDLLFAGTLIKKVDYLLDLTKQYHNLLGKTEIAGGVVNTQNYIWDSDAVFMIERENAHIYLQDELGSTIRLMGIKENNETVYGYDEFGQDLYGVQGKMQPFGYTGYQKDKIANTYFAQAREYQPETGRFGGRDIIKGDVVYPFTLNEYVYCWSNPLAYIDLDGRSAKSTVYTGKSGRNHISCYAYAFGMQTNPVIGEKFPEGGNQRGLLGNDEYYKNLINYGDVYYKKYLAGTSESKQNPMHVLTADAAVTGLSFVPYEAGMTGKKRDSLLVNLNTGYQWYVYDENTGILFNKSVQLIATEKTFLGFDRNNKPLYGESVTDYKMASELLGYTAIVGEFSSKKMECS